MNRTNQSPSMAMYLVMFMACPMDQKIQSQGSCCRCGNWVSPMTPLPPYVFWLLSVNTCSCSLQNKTKALIYVIFLNEWLNPDRSWSFLTSGPLEWETVFSGYRASLWSYPDSLGRLHMESVLCHCYLWDQLLNLVSIRNSSTYFLNI